jgi:carboxymethylenebutenolidase
MLNDANRILDLAMKRLFSTVLLLTLSGCLATEDPSLSAAHLEYVADERRVDLVQYAADDDELRPAIILLHGVNGYKPLRNLYERHAQLLVRNGYRVYAVMYYDEHDQRVMAGSDRKAQQQNYERRVASWLNAINAGIDHIARLSYTDRNRIAVLGFSQGAYLAIGVAATNERVAAVVAMYGGIPTSWATNIGRLPPTLIIHGEADQTVPVSEAYSLAAFLESIGTEYEIRTYANEGHGFDARKHSAAADDAMHQIVRFLNSTLQYSQK